MSKFNWIIDGASIFAKVGNVTLVASPERTASFGAKPARGTKWHAQCSHWNEATRTISRFGRDEYGTLYASRKDAMRAAELIYQDAEAIG